ncbi:MAG: diguanylate cyclase [Pseudomonadota bacterium]
MSATVHPARLLIVEDQAVIAADLEASLTRCGYQVCGTAASGAEALLLTQRHRPDLVLMDIRLQGPLDGIQTAEKLRSEFDTAVIFLSAHTDGATMQRAKLVTPYGFLVKPFDERELQINVEVALHKCKIESQLAHANQGIHRLNHSLTQQMAERTNKLAQALDKLKKAEHDAYYDMLTGLANRAHFIEQLHRQLEICNRNCSCLALLFLDLDGFKGVNDTLGHLAGDALLCAVATRMERNIRRADLAARLGGDEFVVMLVQSDLVQAKLVADKLVATLSRPYRLAQQLVHVSASIGVASYPETGDSSARLLAQADTALYQAKRAGKRCAVAATPDSAVSVRSAP